MPPCTRSQAVKKARKKLHLTDSPHLGAALLHLIHAAPSFLASLSPDALKNLSATSRELRKQVQASVTSISGVRQHHFHLLVKPQWRLIKVLDLSRTKLNVRGMSMLIQGDWPILTKLDLSCNKLGRAAIAKLAKADLPAVICLNLAQNKLDDHAAQLLAGIAWPKMVNVNLSSNYNLGPGAAAWLVQAHWPALKSLDLEGTHVALASLLIGNWPELEVLNLRDCYGAEPAWNPSVHASTSISWRNLTGLNLASHPLDPALVAHLNSECWPHLERLRLAYNTRSSKAIGNFVHGGSWPLLTDLDLSGVCKPEFMGVRMCEILGQGRSTLTGLTRLCFHNNALTSVGVSLLIKGRWEELQDLDLSWNVMLDAAAIAQLVQGNFPNLCTLDLSYIMLDADAIDYLVCGRWPHLTRLYLQHDDLESFLDSLAISVLLLGNWPSLQTLVLSARDVRGAAFLLSGSRDVYGGEFRSVWKPRSGHFPAQWPCLQSVSFKQHLCAGF